MMNFDEIQTRGVPVKMWTRHVQVEDEARAQLRKLAELPVVWPHVAAMPDVHYGIGAAVGSVVPTYRAIIPSAVGVDIGCGVACVKTNLRAYQLPDSLAAMRYAIEAMIPHGRTNNGAPGDRGAWSAPPSLIEVEWSQFSSEYEALCETHPHMRALNTISHLGTLGTGNHFIEVCVDETDAVWVMLHSGSRGVGNRIGSYFIELAKNDMRAAHGNLPEDANLAYLSEGTEHFDDYCEAVDWAQRFARTNRTIMMKHAIAAIQA
jgi:tRNA-splicing ligase RtcB